MRALGGSAEGDEIVTEARRTTANNKKHEALAMMAMAVCLAVWWLLWRLAALYGAVRFVRWAWETPTPFLP